MRPSQLASIVWGIWLQHESHFNQGGSVIYVHKERKGESMVTPGLSSLVAKSLQYIEVHIGPEFHSHAAVCIVSLSLLSL